MYITFYIQYEQNIFTFEQQITRKFIKYVIENKQTVYYYTESIQIQFNIYLFHQYI